MSKNPQLTNIRIIQQPNNEMRTALKPWKGSYPQDKKFKVLKRNSSRATIKPFSTENLCHIRLRDSPSTHQNGYGREEKSVKKIVQEVAISQVPKMENVVTSHVMCKVKHSDEGSLKLKARITVHGNKILRRTASHPTQRRVLQLVLEFFCHMQQSSVELRARFISRLPFCRRIPRATRT